MHLPTLPLTHPIASLLHDLRAWPQTSQEHARRNAMLAATACTQRRMERQDVEDFFAARTSPPQRESAQLRAE